jgi:hypothetical protein
VAAGVLVLLIVVVDAPRRRRAPPTEANRDDRDFARPRVNLSGCDTPASEK